MKLFLFFALVVLMSSCTNREERTFRTLKHAEANTIDIFAVIKETISIDDFIEGNVIYINLELTDNSIIGEFSKVLVEGGLIFVMENGITNQRISIFDKQGNFISNICARGQGPGEYIAIHDFFVDTKNELVGIFCHSRRVLMYDFNGNFIRSINLDDGVREIIYKDGALHTFSELWCPSNLCNAFRVFDLDGNLLFEDYPISRELGRFSLTGFKANTIASDGKNIFLNSINSEFIYIMEKKESIPYLRLDFDRHRMSDRDFMRLVGKGEGSLNEVGRLFNSHYTLFGLKRFFVNRDFIFMLSRKGRFTYMSIYSRESGNVITITQAFLGDIDRYNMVLLSSVVAVDNDFFYAELEAEWLWHLRQEEIRARITDENRREEFSSERLRRWDVLLRDLNEDDNNILVAFRIRPF